MYATCVQCGKNASCHVRMGPGPYYGRLTPWCLDCRAQFKIEKDQYGTLFESLHESE